MLGYNEKKGYMHLYITYIYIGSGKNSQANFKVLKRQM